MKKGLLTVLLASLVLVGCQNYDDQFDDLNAQISALKSQVDGLSSLSGQVSSLSGSISGLSAGVAAAQAAATAAGASADAATAAANGIDLTGLSASLATLQAEVDAVQASLATAATASAVAALQAELDAIEADVDELLATSNVYNKDLTISSAAGLDAAIALGNNINIVNGTVTISQSTAMDATKLQSVIDKIFTVTGNYVFTAGATTVTPMTFDNLASVADLTLTVNGPVSAKTLVSAGTINLVSTYTSKVTGIDFSALTTVTNLETGGTDDTISFASATNVDLGSLANYPGVGSDYGLTITTKKDATLDISSLDDVSATGTATDIALTLNGPKDVNISNITSYSGSITAQNVENLTLNGFKGIITVKGGVENIDITDAEQFVLSSASDLETVVLDVDVASDPDLAATKKAPGAYGGSIAAYTGETPTLDFSSMSDLSSVTLTGSFLDVTFDTLSDLTTIDIEATMRNLTIDDNDNLTSVDVTGATIKNTVVEKNDALVTLELDHTTGLAQVGGSTGTAATYATAQITSNAELASLTFGASKVRNMTVTGNAKLATVDFTGWASLGTSTSVDPTIAVYSNALVATKAQDTDDGTTQYSVDGTDDADDLGTYTTASGMETLSAPLLLYQAEADADAAVHFDTVSIHTIDADAVDGETAGEQNSGNAILYSAQSGTKANWVGAVYLNTEDTAQAITGNNDAVAQTRAWLVDLGTTSTMTLSVGTFDVLTTSADAFGTLTLLGNKNLDLAQLTKSVSTTRATALGATLGASIKGNPVLPNITLISTITSATGGNGEDYTDAQVAAFNATGQVTSNVTTYDKFTLTYDGKSVTATLSGAASWTGDAAGTAVLTALRTAWGAKYSAADSVSGNLSLWGTPTISGQVLQGASLKASSSGSRGWGAEVDLVWTPATTGASGQVSLATSGAATQTFFAHYIGSVQDNSDNTATSDDIIITLTETVAGSGAVAASTGATMTIDGAVVSSTGNVTGADTNSFELITTLVNYASATDTDTTSTIYPSDARGDVVNAEGASEGSITTAGVARYTRSRIHWLG